MKTETRQTRPVEFLLVEDNSADAELMKDALEHSKRSIHVTVVSDGEGALDYLRPTNIYTHNLAPDFILLDLGLPHKSGWEVLSAIKEDSNLKKIPVLILTGSRSDHDLLKARFSFADDYLMKPLDILHFEALINYLEETWLKKDRS